MKTLFKLLPSLALVSFMALQGSMAYAFNEGSSYNPTDDKVYSTSGCTPYAPVTRSYSQYPGYIKNSTTSTISVLCPIVRDRPANNFYYEFKKPSNIPDLLVYARGKANTNNGTECTVYFYSDKGKYLQSDRSKSAPSGKIDLLLERDDTQTVVGTYSLYCSIPSGDYLYSYKVREALD